MNSLPCAAERDATWALAASLAGYAWAAGERPVELLEQEQQRPVPGVQRPARQGVASPRQAAERRRQRKLVLQDAARSALLPLALRQPPQAQPVRKPQWEQESALRQPP